VRSDFALALSPVRFISHALKAGIFFDLVQVFVGKPACRI
jgi:hypothetical protein